MNADISKFNRTAFETIFNDSEEEEEVVTNSITERNTNSAENSSEEGLTADDLKKIENILEKELSESQTKDTMKFLEGFRKDANSNEYISAFVSPPKMGNQVMNYIYFLFLIYRVIYSFRLLAMHWDSNKKIKYLKM